MFYEEPIFFERNRVFRVYQGGKLFSYFFGDKPEDGNYPEEWVVSDVHALNMNSTGPYEGVSKLKNSDMYLNDAIKNYKKEILGDRDELGILTKILDSAIRLPMQAHPDKPFSRKYFHSEHGKEESWVILAVRPGARVYYGFKDGVTIEQFNDAIDKSENDKEIMETLVDSFPVKPGDIVFLPAKMVHAIGAGCLLLEVQEPTDFTVQPERWCGDYKLSDHEMYLGLDRKASLECFDIKKRFPAPLPPKTIKDENGVKYESFIGEDITDNFRVRKVTLTGGEYKMSLPASIYVVIDGEGKIIGNNYEKELKRGDYFLLPAYAKDKFTLTGSVQLIECSK